MSSVIILVLTVEDFARDAWQVSVRTGFNVEDSELEREFPTQ